MWVIKSDIDIIFNYDAYGDIEWGQRNYQEIRQMTEMREVPVVDSNEVSVCLSVRSPLWVRSCVGGCTGARSPPVQHLSSQLSGPAGVSGQTGGQPHHSPPHCICSPGTSPAPHHCQMFVTSRPSPLTLLPPLSAGGGFKSLPQTQSRGRWHCVSHSDYNWTVGPLLLRVPCDRSWKELQLG